MEDPIHILESTPNDELPSLVREISSSAIEQTDPVGSDCMLASIAKLFGAHTNLARVKDSGGLLPIHWASAYSNPTTTQILLNCCPSAASERDNDGLTPLHWCCEANSGPQMVALLLDAYSEAVFTRDKSGKLPIHRAARNGCSPEAIMNLLRVNPESAKTRDLKGKLPLHHACTSATNRRSMESLGVLRCLLESYPAGAETRDFSGRLPLQEALILASYRDNIPYCLDLIRLGADPERPERPGLNALTGIAFAPGPSAHPKDASALYYSRPLGKTFSLKRLGIITGSGVCPF